ncbi:hypothetical protein AAXE64_27110 [Priestia megaterium]|uniref:hypothetical protein n=1 Tax=Priestia megaterium TaxID=1404 RepID=UPI003D05C88F
MTKRKLQDLLNDITAEAFKEALLKANPKLKGKSDEELAETLSLTLNQYRHLTEKALSKVVNQKLLSKIEAEFKQGNSLEVPHLFNVRVYESAVNKNEQGLPKKKLSLTAREKAKRMLNN